MKTSLTSYVLPNLASKPYRKPNCNYQSLIKRILLLQQVHQADAAAKKEQNKELKHPNKIKRELICKINLQLAIILAHQLKGHGQAQWTILTDNINTKFLLSRVLKITEHL